MNYFGLPPFPGKMTRAKRLRTLSFSTCFKENRQIPNALEPNTNSFQRGQKAVASSLTSRSKDNSAPNQTGQSNSNVRRKTSSFHRQIIIILSPELTPILAYSQQPPPLTVSKKQSHLRVISIYTIGVLESRIGGFYFLNPPGGLGKGQYGPKL